MKTAIIRTLAIAMLATSISAFAETGDKKSADTAASCDTTKQHESKQKANGSAEQQKSQGEDQEQRDQDRLLLGIYG